MTTKAQRNAIRTILDRSNSYDPNSLCISRVGRVSAKKDPNKFYRNTKDRSLYFVGWVGNMVTEDGTIREGY